jgi:Domain of unknown function (DUF4349)/Putative zinc-finger
MSTSTHSIAPEEVMAFLDGELSEAGAQAVSSHLQQCAECNAIAEKFRGTSRSLAQWSVPAAPKAMEGSVKESADKKGPSGEIGTPNIFIRASFWTRKQWTVGIGATATVLLLLLAVAIPMPERHGMSVDNARLNIQEQAQPTEKGKMVVSPLARRLPQQAVGTGSDGGFAPRSEPGLADSIGPVQSSTGFAAGGSQTSPGYLPLAGREIGSLIPLQEPMISRVVSLSIVTKDFAGSRASLDAILARRRGYAAELSVNSPENAPRSLQSALRIPAAELSSAVADLKMLGRVENESQSGEEVTQQHADLLARLKNSHQAEQRLQAILTQRTGKISDVLEVEREIARVRGEIEGMEAEQKNLEHRVQFASINLQLTEEYKARLDAPAASISTRIHNAAVAGFKNVSEAVLGILLFFFEAGPTMLLAALVLLVPALLLWRRYRRALASA